MKLLSIVAVYQTVSLVNSAPTVISDDRIRQLDITPVLGRGYSIATNTFQSTCLAIESTSEPSYNYDYYFTDLTSSDDVSSTLSGKISGSFGYWGVKAAVSASGEKTESKSTKTHHVVAAMRIERFYSSVLEDKATLSEDAAHLLQSKDFVGFFKACGPNYVRSIRRAQEVTAIFSYESSDVSSAKEFAASLSISGWGNSLDASMSSTSKQHSISSSLKIEIKGYGLGLNKEGGQTLVATTLSEFNEVMKFAFNSMTKTGKDDGRGDTGMIYGIEVVPWVDNTSFQVKAQLHDEIIHIPIPNNLIPRAIDGECKYGMRVDSYENCCDAGQMKDSTELDDGGNKKKICKPERIIPAYLLKYNLATNGEFVAQLDSVLRSKINNLFEFQKCLIALYAFPKRYEDHYLKSADSVKYDERLEMSVTAKELRMALDPSGDHSAIEILSKELDEFVHMYVDPCTEALSGRNFGHDLNTDPKYFMAEPWFNHPECMHVSCLVDGMTWNRKEKKCTPSLLSMKKDEIDNIPTDYFAPESTDECVKYSADDPHHAGECKFTIPEDKLRKRAVCTHAEYSSLYLMDLFCMPQLSGKGRDEGNDNFDLSCGTESNSS